jgi:hypothetical protein
MYNRILGQLKDINLFFDVVFGIRKYLKTETEDYEVFIEILNALN